MKNVLYRKTILEANKAPDGETPTYIAVTEEANGFAVLSDSFETGSANLVKWFKLYERDKAIEYAVALKASAVT